MGNCAKKMGLFLVLGIGTLTSYPTILYAQTTTMRSTLPGTSAATMGGAFSAIADDASATWYNPGGLGFIVGDNVSVSANTFSKTKHELENALTNETNISESSTSLYPGFAGGTTKIGPFVAGYSYFTTDKENTNETQTFLLSDAATSASITYKRNQLAVGDKLYAGTGLGVAFGANFSLGVSEFYYRRSRQSVLEESSVYPSGTTFDSSIHLSTLNEGTLTAIGMLFKTSTFNAGISVRIPKPLANATTVDSTQIIYTGTSPDRALATQKTHQFDELSPVASTFAVAWKPIQGLNLACEVVYFGATTSKYKSSGGFDTKATADESCGASAEPGFLIARIGAFSNSALVHIPSSSDTDQPPYIKETGYSAGLSIRSKALEAGLGIVVLQGQGYEQPFSGRSEVLKSRSESQSYLLTSRYTL